MTPSQMYRWLAVFSVWQVAGGAPTVITVTDISIIEITGTVPTFPEETNFTIPDFPEFNFTDGSGVTIEFSGVTPQEGSGFTIPEGSGSGNESVVDCNSISNFISVDSSSKSSILVDLLNEAYAVWDKTMQGNFLPYKNRIDTIILSNEFLCAADKLEEINSVLANWAPDGSEEKEIVFTITITGWGTLKQMLTCIEDLEIGGENAGGFTLPPCDSSGFTLPENSGSGFTIVMPTLESSGSGSGSEGSGSGSEGSGSGSEGSGSGGLDIDCNDVLEFIDIDPATNSSKLTDAINEAYASWSRGMKGNFLAYKNRIESVIFSDEFLCASDKLEEIGLVLSNWAPEGSEDQTVVYSIKIEGWSGTLKDFVKCVSEGEGGGSNGGFTLPPCEESSGSGSEGSGSEGSGSEGSGSEGSGSEGSGSGSDIDCSAIMEFIKVDPATNTSTLTTVISDAFATWGRTMKSNFASYKKRIETIIFTDEFPCDSDKLEMIGLVLSNWAPDGSVDQETVYSLKIEGWSGTLKDFVKCVDEGAAGGSDGGFSLPPCDSSSGSGSEGSGSEGSGSEGSGSGVDIDCSAVLKFIEIDSTSNSTELTDVLNEAYATWPRGMKGNFLSYKKRMENIIWGGEFVCAADKLEEIALVLSNWAPDGSSDQQVVYSLTFSGWSGTIKDFVKCIEDAQAGGSDGGFTLPPCETSSVTPPEDGSGSEGSGSEGSGSGMIRGDCNMITSFIEIDSVSNSTILTTSINKVYNTWSRNDKSGFLSYKNLIENIIWSDEISCESEKIERIVQALSRAYPEGTVQQKAIYAIEIEGWGTVGEFISCVESGSSSSSSSIDASGSGSGGGSFTLAPCVTEGPSEVPTTPVVEVTTEAPTTVPSGPDCSVTGSLIEVDTTTNKTVLTTAINDFYTVNMTRTDKANFSSYKKRIETIIYGTEFTTTTDKLDNIVQVLDNYSPEGSPQQLQIESIMIGSWGTVKQFIACVQGA